MKWNLTSIAQGPGPFSIGLSQSHRNAIFLRFPGFGDEKSLVARAEQQPLALHRHLLDKYATRSCRRSSESVEPSEQVRQLVAFQIRTFYLSALCCETLYRAANESPPLQTSAFFTICFPFRRMVLCRTDSRARPRMLTQSAPCAIGRVFFVSKSSPDRRYDND